MSRKLFVGFRLRKFAAKLGLFELTNATFDDKKNGSLSYPVI